MMRCIEAPKIGFMVVWGVSNDSRSYWRQDGAERVGYQPMQNAEEYAQDVLGRPNPLDAIAQQLQGRSFACTNYTQWEEQRLIMRI
jgi:uronate dehydrogenase